MSRGRRVPGRQEESTLHARHPRRATLALAALLLVPAGALAAPADLPLAFVGDIGLDAAGRATGENVAVDVLGRAGVLSSYAPRGVGRVVFDSVQVDGVGADARVLGAGSPTLLVQGDSAVVAVHDNVNAVLRAHALDATGMRWRLADGWHATLRDGSRAVVDVRDEAGVYAGSLVSVGADAASGVPAPALAITSRDVRIAAEPGTHVVFLAKPAAVPDAYHEAVVSAAAGGRLAAAHVTALSGGDLALSSVPLAVSGLATATSGSFGAVETRIQSSAVESALVAYDLAYEGLPVRSAADVAVFIDGQRVPRVADQDAVVAAAARGESAVHAAVADGRAYVIAATPRFDTTASHRVLVATGATAVGEAQALAEATASGAARAQGGFVVHDAGLAHGAFATALVARGDSLVRDHASLAHGAQILAALDVADNGLAAVDATDADSLVVAGKRATLTLHDDVHGALVLDAQQAAQAAFALAPGVRAEPAGEDVLRLVDARGTLAHLVALDGATFAVEDARVLATLEPGARVVQRFAAQGSETDDLVARAIAQGTLGHEVVAGARDGAHVTAWSQDALATAASAVGSARASQPLGGAHAVAFDARPGVLAARGAHDLVVLVDGAPALPAPDAQSALRPGAQARWFAEPLADGGTRVIVGGVSQAREVVLDSRLVTEPAARAVGAFHLDASGAAVGRFLAARVDAPHAALTHVSAVAEGRALLDTLVVGGAPFSAPRLHGAATVVAESADARVELADQAAGEVRTVAKRASDVVMRLAPGVQATSTAAGVVTLHDTTGHAATLVGTGASTLAVSGDVVTTSLAEGERLVLRHHGGIESSLSSRQRTMLADALASGRLGGAASVSSPAQGALEASSLGEGATVAATYADDLTMTVRSNAQRVEAVVSGTASQGRTFLIALDAGTLPALARGEGRVLFDGAPIGQADSLADALDASDDEGAAEYFAFAGEAGSLVLVSVPHFSVHTVTLEARAPTPLSWSAVAAGALAVVVAAQAVLLARRKTR